MRPVRLLFVGPFLLAAAGCASSGSSTTPASTIVQNTMPIIGDNASAGEGQDSLLDSLEHFLGRGRLREHEARRGGHQ